MKKITMIIITILIAVVIIYFQLINNSKQTEPKTYYNVYLDGSLVQVSDDLAKNIFLRTF